MQCLLVVLHGSRSRNRAESDQRTVKRANAGFTRCKHLILSRGRIYQFSSPALLLPLLIQPISSQSRLIFEASREAQTEQSRRKSAPFREKERARGDSKGERERDIANFAT